MPTVDQYLIPSLPASLPVKRYKADSCSPLVDQLRLASRAEAVAVVPLGISLRLSENGFIEAVSLSTPDEVFQITIAKHSSHAALASVLGYQGVLFASFDMARIAILLQRQLGVNIRGVDLATYQYIPSRQPPAVYLAQKLLSNRVRGTAICAIFYRKSNNDLCLRAWLSAWYAPLQPAVSPSQRTSRKQHRVEEHPRRREGARR